MALPMSRMSGQDERAAGSGQRAQPNSIGRVCPLCRPLLPAILAHPSQTSRLAGRDHTRRGRPPVRRPSVVPDPARPWRDRDRSWGTGKEDLLRVVGARLRAAILAIVIAVLATGAQPASSVAHDPPGMTHFMYAMGQVESGGRYDALNTSSGAYGKYQIMPSNWPTWAARYVGDADAPQSPANQERVAHGKMRDLHRWLGSWRQVAYWWLTGRDGRSITWTTYATSYVNKVMRLYNQRLGVSAAPVDTRTWVGETSARITYTGRWRPASHSGYRGGRVQWATADGATATLPFAGSKVTWYGPMGPTRGKAIVRIDGEVVKVVDLRARTFLSRRALFTMTWPEPGEHTIQIEVERVASRPYVAIDAFAITP